MDKAARENQALRTASEAVKLMALSQGVECKLGLSKELYTNKCPKLSSKDLENETGLEQWKRSIAFLRYLQQGITPPVCLKELPIEEEKTFIEICRGRYSELDDVDLFIKHIVKDTTPTLITDINKSYQAFITGGAQGNPLDIYNCRKQGYPYLNSMGRFVPLFSKTDEILEYIFEYWDYSLLTQYPSVADTASNKLDNIDIALIDDIAKTKDVDFAITTEINTKRGNSAPAIITTNYKNTMFINTSFNLDNIFNAVQRSSVYATSGKTIAKLKLIKKIFKDDMVYDVHPWLMYLLMTTPATYEAFMKGAFGGKMAPPLNHKLAYYIVAHYVANKDYAANPSVFYKVDRDSKYPILKRAVEKRQDKPILDDLLTKGYSWLNRESDSQVTPPSIQDLVKMFSPVNYKRAFRGGKRLTRKALRSR